MTRCSRPMISAMILLIASGSGAPAAAGASASLHAAMVPKDVETEQAAEQLVSRSRHRTVVVEFSAVWCSYCRDFAPVVHEVAMKLGPELEFVRIDIDRVPRFSHRFHVTALPMILILDGGTATGTLQGLMTPERLTAALLPYLD